MGAEVQVVAAELEHARALAPLMRAADVAELQALGLTPERALADALRTSEVAFALVLGGEVAALFGLGPRVPAPFGEAACVWALSGAAVDRHRKAFLRASRAILEALLSHCALLWNWVDARYAGAVRWVRWLGFAVGPAQPFGPAGQLFHPISIRREAVAWVR